MSIQHLNPNFYEAIPLGVDVEKVKIPFLRFVLDDVLEGPENLKIDKALKKEIVAVNRTRTTYFSLDEERKAQRTMRLLNDAAAVADSAAADDAVTAYFIAMSVADDATSYAIAETVAAIATEVIAVASCTIATNPEVRAKRYADRLLEMLRELK